MNFAAMKKIPDELDLIAVLYRDHIRAIEKEEEPDLEKQKKQRSQAFERLSMVWRSVMSVQHDNPEIEKLNNICLEKAKHIKELNTILTKKAEKKKAELQGRMKSVSRGKQIMTAYTMQGGPGGYGHGSKPPKVMNFTR